MPKISLMQIARSIREELDSGGEWACFLNIYRSAGTCSRLPDESTRSPRTPYKQWGNPPSLR